MTVDLQPVAEVPRDRYSRPMIMPPGGGKEEPYTRCTRYVGCLEDTYNLGEWQKRMVAAGMAQRPDLVLRSASLGLEPEQDVKPWKTAMDEVTTAATETARAKAAANIGTAIHALTERMDRGLPLGLVPKDYKPHLDAYEAATAAFTAHHIERFTVHDGLKIGGTPDRILEIPGREKLIIGDIKTGSTEYGVGKMAMQLAVYAHSQLYDPATGRRTSPGEVDHEWGLIIALSAKTGQCELKWIDLAAGWEAVQLATKVRAWRNRRNLIKPWDREQTAPAPATATAQTAEYVDTFQEPDTDRATAVALKVAVERAASPEELVELWQTARDRWTPELTELAATRKRALSA